MFHKVFLPTFRLKNKLNYSHKIITKRFLSTSNQLFKDFYDDKNELTTVDKDIENEVEITQQTAITEYEKNGTVEEVRLQLVKESEILTDQRLGTYQYPAGFNHVSKNDLAEDIEVKDTLPFKNFDSPNLLASTTLIIGGGLIGTSIAYFLREIGLDIAFVNVIDRDFKNLYSSSGLTATGLQQQFSTHECVQLSQNSTDFLRTVRRNLNVFNKEPPDIDYCPQGNLVLANEEDIEDVLKNAIFQNKVGLKTIVYNKDELKIKYPWLNSDDIGSGSICLENEGHFNSKSLLYSMKTKAENLGARFFECEFVDFNMELHDINRIDGLFLKKERFRRAIVRDKSGNLHQVEFEAVIICAGHENYKFGELLGTGNPDHYDKFMRLPLPLKKRKRYYYVFECDEGPGIDFPTLLDPSGVFCRADGYAGRYIAGKCPSENEEINNNNSDVDYHYFKDIIQPILVKRVPSFKNLKLKRGWSCFEDVNTIDQMPLIGWHPFLDNVYIVGGLGVHSAAFSPAIGRSVAEHILFGEFKTVDLTRFGWQRFIIDYKLNKEKLGF